MGCLDPDVVVALVDGTVTADERAAIDEHIDDCAPCRRLVSESVVVAVEPDPRPARLGRYELRDLVGRGGMGEVYRARDPRLDRDVAVKVIRVRGRTTTPADLERFEREARAAAAINHPNVMAVFDVGHDGGIAYVVSELLRGETLRARLQRARVRTAQALGWACAIGHGLAAAHERGIVHRDIKPDNVFVTEDGQVKILDFGVAAVRGAEVEGVIAGTVGYMAPEQVRGEACDARADIFAFGALVFEMLTGALAFPAAAPDTVELAESALRDDPFELAPAAAAAMPPAVAEIIRRCLEKSAAARFQAARDVAFALELVATPAPVRRARRWPWLAALAAVAFTAAIGGRASRPVVLPPVARVAAIDLGSHEVLGARSGGGVLYATIATGDGLGIDGTAALRTLRRSADGTLMAVPNTDGDCIAAASDRELLVLRKPERALDVLYGQLARLDRDGRELPIANTPGVVVAADFMPGGEIAVIRVVGAMFRVEAPIGHVRYEASEPLLALRVAPSGALAFIQRSYVDTYWTSRFVTIETDRDPARAGAWQAADSVAWDGDDLLVSGELGGVQGVWRIEQSAARVVWTAPHPVFLHDVVPGGALLVIERDITRHIRARRPAWGRERDLSLADQSMLVDLSLDGRWLSGAEGDELHRDKQVFVRALDGGPAVVIGRGVGGPLSGDGRRLLMRTPQPPLRLAAVTLGTAPATTELPGDAAEVYAAAWRGDAVVSLVGGREPGLYEQPLDAPPHRIGGWPGSASRPVAFRMSPRGDAVATRDVDGRPALIDLPALHVTPINGGGDRLVVGWSSDGSALWLASSTWPLEVERRGLDGSHAPLLTIPAPAPGAFFEMLRIAGDGATYAYSYAALRCELYQVEVGR